MQNQFNNLESLGSDKAYYLKTYCNGISHSISNEALAIKFNMDKRTLRSLITHLIVKHGIPIGSCSRNHSGIYFISNQQDFDIASRELMGRIKKLSRRHKCLRLNWQDWKGEIVKEQLTLSWLGK